MNEIKISTQAEFDALVASKDFTIIFIVGALSRINRAIDNSVIYVSDSAKIGSVSDSAKIDYVYGYGSANIHNDCSPILHGYSVIWAFNGLCKPIQKSTNSIILRPSLDPLEIYFNSNPINISGETVLLYKRVSSKLLTQEKTSNETTWSIGEEIVHPNWNPTNSECGEGKFHACSRPIFCDSFRSDEGDRYICIEVNKADLYAWKNPAYPRKITFKKGIVLYECDREGNKM